MTRDIPGARQVIISGAGHMVNLEKPQEFDRVLAQFIAIQTLY
jgi:pimeloyl-ACP methyl ester carboxylesterase